jgi:hypothetical protein
MEIVEGAPVHRQKARQSTPYGSETVRTPHNTASAIAPPTKEKMASAVSKSPITF